MYLHDKKQQGTKNISREGRNDYPKTSSLRGVETWDRDVLPMTVRSLLFTLRMEAASPDHFKTGPSTGTAVPSDIDKLKKELAPPRDRC